jgi:uncharacterized protein (TIGR00730 family)
VTGKRICVFCGSSPGRDEVYLESARGFARALARHGLGLVYGGASVGLMGALADEALGAGVEVHGVIPEVLQSREIAHRGLTELHVVASMHDRKATMASLADAFVALPGGLGTLEELFEVWTWGLLGLHRKPCALLDVQGFYRPLLAFVDGAVSAGFVRPQQRESLLVSDDAESLIAGVLARIEAQSGAPPEK